jgi:hypothetical protein
MNGDKFSGMDISLQVDAALMKSIEERGRRQEGQEDGTREIVCSCLPSLTLLLTAMYSFTHFTLPASWLVKVSQGPAEMDAAVPGFCGTGVRLDR